MTLYVHIFLLMMTMTSLVSTSSIRPADKASCGTFCYLDHPQHHFCTVDFVGLVTIFGKQRPSRDFITYNVLVLNVYKDVCRVQSGVGQIIEVDINAPTVCDPNLEISTTYLISASFGHYGLEGLTTSGCLWHQKLDDNFGLADVESVVSLYKKNCGCEIVGIYETMETISQLGGPPGDRQPGPPGSQNSPPGQQYSPPGSQQNGPPGQQYSPPGSQQNGPPGSQQNGPPGQQYSPPGHQQNAPSGSQQIGPRCPQNGPTFTNELPLNFEDSYSSSSVSSGQSEDDDLSFSTSNARGKCFFNGETEHACVWDQYLGCRWTEI